MYSKLNSTTPYSREHNQPLFTNLSENNCNHFPKSLDHLKVIQHISGGSGGIWVLEDKLTNRRYALKVGSHIQQLKEEIINDSLYQVMGIPVPNFVVYEQIPDTLAQTVSWISRGLYRLSEYIETDETFINDPEKVIKSNYKNSQTQIAHGFIMDAFLGNVDIAAKLDNIKLATSGILYRTDNGATVRTRAKGDYKQSTYVVEELESLFSKKSEYGALFYQSLSKEQKQIQVNNLLDRSDKLLETLYILNSILKPDLGDELIQIYCDRLVYLKNCYASDYPLEICIHPAKKDYTAAGVLLYQRNETKQIEVLMGKRISHEWWGNLGGKSDEKDVDLAHTAARETKEESEGLVSLTRYDLINKPYYDLVTRNDKEEPYIYRMYLYEHTNLDINLLKKRAVTANSNHEYTDFTWIRLEELLDALKTPKCQIQEGQSVVLVGENKIALHPPLYQMLSQSDAKDALLNLNNTFVKEKNKQKKRILFGPQFLSKSVAEQASNKSEMLAELKNRFNLKRLSQQNKLNCNNNNNNNNKDLLTQSELHLKELLGYHFRQNNLLENINIFFGNHSLAVDVTEDNKIQFASMIEAERNCFDKIVLYHAAITEIAFLYDVFTQIRKQLMALPGENFRVFRIFDEHTKAYSDIETLIKIFSKDGEIIINDHDDRNYQELALSTNFFLFGNAQVHTSASYYLYLKNSNTSPPDMQGLLKYAFANLDVEDQVLMQLLELYEQYFKASGPRIYQIFIDNEIVDKMVYAAGGSGRLNPLVINGKETYKPSEIINAIKANPQSYGEYIRNLQARFFLHPEFSYLSDVVSVKEYSQTILPKAYYQNFQAIVRKAVQASLAKAINIKELYFRPTLHQQTRGILQKLGLLLPFSSIEMQLAKNIRSGNGKGLITLLQQHPGADLSSLPNLDYSEHGDKNSLVSFSYLAEAFSRLDLGDLLVDEAESGMIAKEILIKSIKKAKDFNSMMHHLSQSRRDTLFDFCKPRLMDLIKTAANFRSIVEPLGQTQRKYLFNYYETKLETFIQTYEDLLDIIIYLDDDQKSILLKNCRKNLNNLIKTEYEFNGIMVNLYGSRDELLDNFMDNFVNIIVTSQDFNRLMRPLYHGERNRVFAYLINHIFQLIKKAEDFALITEHLTESQQKMVLHHYEANLTNIVKDAKDFSLVIAYLSAPHREFVFDKIKINLCQLIKKVDDFYWIQKCLPYDLGKDAFNICKAEQADLIKTVDDFIEARLPSYADEILIDNYKSKLFKCIKTMRDFILLFQNLSRPQKDILFKEYRVNLIDLIRTTDAFEILFRNLSETQRDIIFVDYLVKLVDLIKTVDDFIKIAGLLSESQKEMMIQSCKSNFINIIKTTSDYNKIFDATKGSVEAQLAIDEVCETKFVKITKKAETIADFILFFGRLSELQRELVFDNCKAKLAKLIKTDFDFKKVSQHLTSSQRLWLITEFLNDNDKLADMIETIKFFKFCMRYLTPLQQDILFDKCKLKLVRFVCYDKAYFSVMRYLSQEKKREFRSLLKIRYTTTLSGLSLSESRLSLFYKESYSFLDKDQEQYDQSTSSNISMSKYVFSE